MSSAGSILNDAAVFVNLFLTQCYIRGANPDKMLERLHQNIDFAREAADLAMRYLLPECECPTLAEEPTDGTFGYDGVPLEDDLFRRMLEAQFANYEQVAPWLPRYSEQIGANDHKFLFAYRAGKAPARRKFFCVTVAYRMPVNELLEILRRLHWGLGFLYDLVRVRSYTHTEPLLALGSLLKVMHHPQQGMKTNLIPSVWCVGTEAGGTEMHMCIEGQSGANEICEGRRLLLWRKDTSVV